jgi:hypothetical protein
MESTEKQPDKLAKPETRQVWQPMALTYLGQITELVQQGGGKSGDGGDMGDIRKPRGQG